MGDLTVLSTSGELAASLWRSWLTPLGYLGCLLVDILVASSLPPPCLLVDNYCLLVENFNFRRVSDVAVGLLAFFFPPEDLLGRFIRILRDVLVIS